MNDAGHVPLRLGVSSCLLGEPVRYDGGDKRDTWISGTLARYCEFVPLCPEVGIGLGVPRPPVRLSGHPARPRALGVDDPSLDVTDSLQCFGRRAVGRLQGISGYVFKSRSPSCGLGDVDVVGARGAVRRTGTGLYAREIRRALPLLPVEDEQGLADPARRDAFLERVFVMRRWQCFRQQRLTARGLRAFHEAHRLLLMAHGDKALYSLDDLLAHIGRRPLRALAAKYIETFMAALQRRATASRQAAVLRCLVKPLEPRLDSGDRQELLEALRAYRAGRARRLVVLTLLRHHYRHHPDDNATRQVYLYPDAEEGVLRDFL